MMSSPTAPSLYGSESDQTNSDCRDATEPTSEDSATRRRDETTKEIGEEDLDNNIISPGWQGSLIEYYGPNVSYCGYCKRDDVNGRRSFDMQSYRLTVSDYQELLDRGWRRSGKYCYSPNNKTICCPNYPIVCKTTEFNLTWSKRRCIENMNCFLITGSTKDRVKLNYVASDNDDSDRASSHGLVRGKTFDQLKASTKARDRRFVKSCENKVRLNKISLETAMEQLKNKHEARRMRLASLESYLYPKKSSLRSCQKQSSISTANFKPKHKLKIKLCHVQSDFSEESREDEHAIIVRYQRAVHGEERNEWTMSRFRDFLVDSPLIREPLKGYDYLSQSRGSAAGDEANTWTIDVNSHVDPSDEYLLAKPPELPSAYGTYHCNYYLDDRLIAVGVLDVLPKCITTVYFFYDPDYAFLNLGIYSALVEISMVRQMCQHYIGETPASENQLINYHLGFYVHESKKMHYKTKFKPSFLLCSKTLRYVPTEICLEKLKDKKFAVFSNESREEPDLRTFRIFEIPIYSPVTLDNRTLIHYINWLETNLGNEYVELLIDGYLITYVRLVGPKLTTKICLRLDAVHRTLLERHRRAPPQPPPPGIQF